MVFHTTSYLFAPGHHLSSQSTPGTFSNMATAAVADMDGAPAGDLPDDIVDVGLLRSYLASLLTPGEWNLGAAVWMPGEQSVSVI